MESFKVALSAETGTGLTIDGKTVVNASRVTFDASKPYVEVEVVFIPSEAKFAIEGAVELHCAYCHGPLEVVDRSGEKQEVPHGTT